MELPLWLAESLAEDNFVQIDLPRIFSQRNRDAMLASPETVRLRDRSPFYYEAGLRLSSACKYSEDAKTLPSTIQFVLAARVRAIISKSVSSGGGDSSKFVEALTDLEQKLFWGGFHYTKALLEWRKGKSRGIKALGACNRGAEKGGGGWGAARGIVSLHSLYSKMAS